MLLILALAAGLRLYGLGDESLWGDEGLTIGSIVSRSYGSFFSRSSWATQAPLYFFLNKAWCEVFGLSVEALRFPSVIYGVFSVLMIYQVGRTMFDRRAGLLAALFLAVNPFAVHFSQDARPYSLFMLTGLASVYFMVRLMRRFRLGDAIGYVLSTLAVLYCHAFGPFILPLQVIGFAVYFWSGDFAAARRQWGLLLLKFVVLLLLFSPQLTQFAKSYLTVASGKGALAVRAPSLARILRTLRLYFAWAPLAVAILALGGAGALWGIVADRRARPHLLFLLATPVCFLLLPWILSMMAVPILRCRYTCPTVPALILVLAWSLSAVPAVARRVVVAALLLMTLLPLTFYYTKVDKDPFRQTAEILHQQVREGDVVMLNPSWPWQAFTYYFRPPPGVRLEMPARGARLDAVLRGAERVWEVRTHARKPNAVSAALDARAPVEGVLHVNDQLDVNPLANSVARITIVRRTVGP